MYRVAQHLKKQNLYRAAWICQVTRVAKKSLQGLLALWGHPGGKKVYRAIWICGVTRVTKKLYRAAWICGVAKKTKVFTGPPGFVESPGWQKKVYRAA